MGAVRTAGAAKKLILEQSPSLSVLYQFKVAPVQLVLYTQILSKNVQEADLV